MSRIHVQLRHASFFSGIGGFDLGFERAGIISAFQCEVKDYCRYVLQKHWPDVPKSEDICYVKATEIPNADVWSAGFPCQDLSLARMGKRDGLRGAKSGLFFEVARLVGERSPRVLVLENVHGLLTSHGGRDFTVVLKTLDELGYGVAWRVFNSQHFGIPQSRRRVYIVGVYKDPECAAKILFEPKCSKRNNSARRSDEEKSDSLFQKVVGNPGTGFVKARAHCIYAESARHTGTDWSRNYVWYPDGRVRRFLPGEVEEIQGFPKESLKK
jgi:DNA (cytosine-5)-methyltransferase 1